MLSCETNGFWLHTFVGKLSWGSLPLVTCYIYKRERKKSVVARKRGSSVVRHLPLVLEVPGSIPAPGEENFGVRTRFL